MNFNDNGRNKETEITKKIDVNDDSVNQTNIGDIITPVSEQPQRDGSQMKSTVHGLETDGVVNNSAKG